MAVYTDISDAELEAFLAGYDLGAPLSFKGIAEGVENSNFLAGDHARPLHPDHLRAAGAREDLPFFLGFMQHLAAHGFPARRRSRTGTARRCGDLRGKPAAIVTFLTGFSVRRPTAAALPRGGRGAGLAAPGGRGLRAGAPTISASLAGGRSSSRCRPRPTRSKPGLGGGHRRRSRAASTAAGPAACPSGVIHADSFPTTCSSWRRPLGPRSTSTSPARTRSPTTSAWPQRLVLRADGSFNVTAARAFFAGYEDRRPLDLAERARRCRSSPTARRCASS